jgi:hypothetical protein
MFALNSKCFSFIIYIIILDPCAFHFSVIKILHRFSYTSKPLASFQWDNSWRIAMHMVFRCRKWGLKRQTNWPSLWNTRILEDFINQHWIYVLIQKGMSFLTREIILEFQNEVNIFHSNLIIWIAPLGDSKESCKQLVLQIKLQAFKMFFLVEFKTSKHSFL